MPGFGDQRNIELLVEAGFSLAEAIRIATLNGTIYMGRDASIGSIASGKAADLVVWDATRRRRLKTSRMLTWSSKITSVSILRN